MKQSSWVPSCPLLSKTCITCPISQSCGSLAFRLFENQTPFFDFKQLLISHLNLFTAMLWDRLLHAFSCSISCHHWTTPLVFFDLKNWPWKQIAWWNTPAGYSLGNSIRDCNPYHTEKNPFLLGLVFLFGFFFACFGLFGVFVYFSSNRYKTVSILCVRLMQSNFTYKNRLPRSKCNVYLMVEEIMRLWLLSKPVC